MAGVEREPGAVPYLPGTVTAVVGLALLGWLTLLPWWRSHRAEGWIAVPCRIERLDLVAYSGWRRSTSASYRIEAEFHFDYAGESWTSRRFGLAGAHRAPIDRCRDLIAVFRAIREPSCWLDPSDPASAVLDRRIDPQAWVGIPVAFPFFGLAAVLLAIPLRAELGRRRALAVAGFVRRPAPLAGWLTGSARTTSDDAVASVLVDRPWSIGALRATRDVGILLPPWPTGRWALREARRTRLAAAGHLVAMTAVGLGAAWAVYALRSMGPSGESTVGWVLLAVTVAAGIWAATLLAWHGWALRVPDVVITIEPAIVAAGDSLRVAWRTTGRAGGITGAVLSWVVDEVVHHPAAPRRPARDERRRIAERAIAEVQPGVAGALRVAVPAAALPSIDAIDVRVEWSLRVRVAIALSPDAD